MVRGNTGAPQLAIARARSELPLMRMRATSLADEMERHVGVRGGTGSQGWCFLGAVVGFFGVGRGGFFFGRGHVYKICHAAHVLFCAPERVLETHRVHVNTEHRSRHVIRQKEGTCLHILVCVV